jgi:hypothetical protein
MDAPAGVRAHPAGAQLGVLGHLELGLLHRLGLGHLLALQLADFLLQRGNRREIAAHADQRVARHQRGHLQRIEHGAGHLAHGGEGMRASTTSSSDRDQREHRHLDPRGSALLEERRRTVFHDFQ